MSEDRETRGKGQLVIAVAWLVAIVVPALVVPWCADFFVTTQRGFFALTAAAYALASIGATLVTKSALKSSSVGHGFLRWFAEDGLAWIIWLVATFAALNYSVHQIYTESGDHLSSFPNSTEIWDHAAYRFAEGTVISVVILFFVHLVVRYDLVSRRLKEIQDGLNRTADFTERTKQAVERFHQSLELGQISEQYRKFADALLQHRNKIPKRTQAITDAFATRTASLFLHLTKEVQRQEPDERQLITAAVYGSMFRSFLASMSSSAHLGRDKLPWDDAALPVVFDTSFEHYAVAVREIVRICEESLKNEGTQAVTYEYHTTFTGSALEWLAPWPHSKYTDPKWLVFSELFSRDAREKKILFGRHFLCRPDDITSTVLQKKEADPERSLKRQQWGELPRRIDVYRDAHDKQNAKDVVLIACNQENGRPWILWNHDAASLQAFDKQFRNYAALWESNAPEVQAFWSNRLTLDQAQTCCEVLREIYESPPFTARFPLPPAPADWPRPSYLYVHRSAYDAVIRHDDYKRWSEVRGTKWIELREVLDQYHPPGRIKERCIKTADELLGLFPRGLPLDLFAVRRINAPKDEKSTASWQLVLGAELLGNDRAKPIKMTFTTPARQKNESSDWAVVENALGRLFLDPNSSI